MLQHEEKRAKFQSVFFKTHVLKKTKACDDTNGNNLLPGDVFSFDYTQLWKKLRDYLEEFF